MKIPALIAIAALTCGTAFAQGYGSGSTQRAPATGNQSTAAAPDSPSNSADEGLLAKTKRAFHRLGEKMRSAGSKAKDTDTTASKSDTRSMGAAGSDTSDSARQSRMDQAYANSKSKSQDK
jgi:hypothetical protein